MRFIDFHKSINDFSHAGDQWMTIVDRREHGTRSRIAYLKMKCINERFADYRSTLSETSVISDNERMMLFNGHCNALRTSSVVGLYKNAPSFQTTSIRSRGRFATFSAPSRQTPAQDAHQPREKRNLGVTLCPWKRHQDFFVATKCVDHNSVKLVLHHQRDHLGQALHLYLC